MEIVLAFDAWPRRQVSASGDDQDAGSNDTRSHQASLFWWETKQFKSNRKRRRRKKVAIIALTRPENESNTCVWELVLTKSSYTFESTNWEVVDPKSRRTSQSQSKWLSVVFVCARAHFTFHDPRQFTSNMEHGKQKIKNQIWCHCACVCSFIPFLLLNIKSIKL